MTFSIRRHLLFLLLSVIGSVWAIVTWRVYIDTQHEVEELFDANLAQNARILLALIKHELQEHETNKNEWVEIEEHLSGHRYEHKLAFLVRASDEHILIRSTTSPLFSMPNQDFSQYSDYQENSYLWRVFTLKSQKFFVQTGERYDIRDELISEIMSSTLAILLMTFPLLAILIWMSVGSSFKPLQQVAHEITARTSNQLHPLKINKIPLEINILVESLNSLFIRLASAFENERRFTADAAHELRTPLAGLKTQAQVAHRAIDPQQRQQALQQILIGVDRATHLVTQLLTLARMDATQIMPTSPIDMHELIHQLIIDLTLQALEKGIDLGLEKTAICCVIEGDQEALYLMYRNLVDNAIRYTPAGGQVTVSLDNRNEGKLTVTVSDTGSGIPSEQRAQIFERFYRGANQNIQGSGLGLSIVQRVAQLHHITIQLDNVENGNGLGCISVFPLSKKTENDKDCM